MKKNYVIIGKKILKLGFPCLKEDYFIEIIKLGAYGSLQQVKICEIVRVDWRDNGSRIILCNGSFIDDYRCVREVAMLLPYNHFGYYRMGCIFNMHRVKSINSKAKSVMLDNKSVVKMETRAVFNRFDEDYLKLKR